MRLALALFLLLAISGCNEKADKTRDFASKPDKWIEAITVPPDSKVVHVGKTSAILGATKVAPLRNVTHIAIGDTVDGVHIGAIKCVFFERDASWSNEQFMWRGKWGCQAGRTSDEVSNAVAEDGSKNFDYIHAAPVTLTENVQ